MKKQNKKLVLVALALLAMVTVALPLVGCKNDSVSEPPTETSKNGSVTVTDIYGNRQTFSMVSVPEVQ